MREKNGAEPKPPNSGMTGIPSDKVLKTGNVDRRIEQSCCLCCTTTNMQTVTWILKDDGLLDQIATSGIVSAGSAV